MKNTPTGPSFAKRSLLARHKDLEERIAKTKIQLIQAADRAQSKTTLPQVDLNPANPSTATPVVPTSTNPDLKVAMEDNLRRLVMESKRNKGQSPSATLLSPPDPDSHSATIIAVGTSTTSSPTPAPSVNLVVPEKSLATFSQDALDDLAVSFITEAIQNIKASPPLPPRTSHSAIKLVLAAKQQRLEKQIAESKVLMAQLTSARTKQEKDRILAAMRERSRCVC
jgi:hypothetical protein